MITQDYLQQKAAIRQAFQTEGIVLLQQFVESPSTLRKFLDRFEYKEEFHPLRHKWRHAAVGKIDEITAFLSEICGEQLKAEVYRLKPGDYSLLSDMTKEEHGIVAFLDVSKSWKEEWGGYVSIEQEKMEMPVNSLLLVALHKHRWFVKYLNHRAKEEKVLVVFRE